MVLQLSGVMESRNSLCGHEEKDKESGESLQQREQPPCGSRGSTAFRQPHTSNSRGSPRGSKREDKGGRPDTMGDSRPGRTRARNRNSLDYENNKDSDSYYSDEYNEEATTRTGTYVSDDRSRSPSVISRSPSPRKGYMKMIPASPGRINRANKKTTSRHFPNKGVPRWGFRSQSLNKESPPKDIDLVTKRVLSARLLKINELRNQVTEQQIRLDELQKENKALKRLQYRQERALNKFEDTENEISQLISRHNNEVRNLRERLRKSQERERTTEKRLKDTEEELYRTKSSLQKLKKLSEDKHLAERDELTKKLVLVDSRLEDSERRVKDLEKNIELTNSSFQRQLASERKKAHEFQEEANSLQEELKRLNQKLKERERELDAKNIYANRMLKPSPKKDTEVVPRKKGPGQNTTKGVQTEDYFLPVDFPPPPPPVVDLKTEAKEQEVPDSKVRESLEREERERADRLRKEKEIRGREREIMLKREQEQRALEEKAQKLRQEWEKEELERKRRENQLLQEKLSKEENNKRDRDGEQERHFENLEEERRKKELLLAKMREIDMEKESSLVADVIVTNPSQSRFTDSASLSGPSDRMQKAYKFSEPVENLFNGLPVHGRPSVTTKAEGQGRRGVQSMQSNEDLAFGSYAPSFGKGSGRTVLLNQKDDLFEEKPKGNDTKKDKKSNLMEQLFGSGASTSVASRNGLISPPESNKTSTGSLIPWEKNNTAGTRDDIFSSEGRNMNSIRHRSQLTATKPAVKAVDMVEDEIEEVVL